MDKNNVIKREGYDLLIREVRNVALITLILGVIQVIVTIPIGYFGSPAVLGTILGCTVAILNFALMGIILERSLSNSRAAAGLVGTGYILRLIFIAAAVVWAMKVEYLNYVCAVIPLIFPQISIFIINAVRKKEGKSDDERT